MARTLVEIREDINLSNQVTRKDILEVLNIYANPDEETANVKDFLDSIDEGILTAEKKAKILDDLLSYSVDYPRQ